MKKYFVLWIVMLLVLPFSLSFCGAKKTTKTVKENMEIDTFQFPYSEIKGIGLDSVYNRRDHIHVYVNYPLSEGLSDLVTI